MKTALRPKRLAEMYNGSAVETDKSAPAGIGAVIPAKRDRADATPVALPLHCQLVRQSRRSRDIPFVRTGIPLETNGAYIHLQSTLYQYLQTLRLKIEEALLTYYRVHKSTHERDPHADKHHCRL